MENCYDFVSSVLDEISLEGLDGITLEMLWKRLDYRPQFPIAIDDDSKNYLWAEVITKHREIEMYQIPKPRPVIPLHSRYERIDDELGIVVEPEGEIPDPYEPILLVKDGNVMGSCYYYKTRTNVTSEIKCDDGLLMSLGQVVQKWGDSLVLVASPRLRLLSLIGTETNPLVNLSVESYSFLERIARSRFHGEVTQGRQGLLALKAPYSKQLHYHRKKLSDYGLITKQVHYLKSIKGTTSNGSLLHLTRFYVERKTKMELLMNCLKDILKSKPQYRVEFKVAREELGVKDTTFKKLLHRSMPKTLKVIFMPHMEMYPNADKKDTHNIHGIEKFVKVLQYLPSEDGENEDDENDGDDKDKQSHALHFDCSKIYHDTPLMYQVYRHIQAAGPDGISGGDLGKLMTLPRLDVRNLLRQLLRKNFVISVLLDRGRQKVTKYMLACFGMQNEAYNTLKEHEEMQAEEEERSVKRKSVDDSEAPSHKKVKFDSENSSEGAKNVPADSNYHLIKSQVQEIEVTKYFTGASPKLGNVNQWASSKVSQSNQMTLRKLKRSNVILEYLKEKNSAVVYDLQRHIMEKEKEEGYDFKIDKKSITRLVHYLKGAKKIKLFKAVLTLEDKKAEIEFVCNNSVELSDPCIHSAVEQAKFKYFGVSRDKKEKKPEKPPAPPKEDKSEKSEKTPSPVAFKKYGPHPKFTRAKALHTLLFYMAYENKRSRLEGEIQHVYHGSMTWKRFIPPLPDYERKGWCLMADVYSNMPLSMFVKIACLRSVSQELSDFLADEEKCHYLIKYLPQSLRNNLLDDRKYLFSTTHVLNLLCHMGLVSLGPQTGKQKDQVFFYVHKNINVKDTTTSVPGYLHINLDCIYEIKHFAMETTEDVETFWIDLEAISCHTPLGKYNTAIGKTFKIIDSNNKPELVASTKNKAFDDVVDNGDIPGDGLGAGGFDSVLFLHQKRNWLCGSQRKFVELPKADVPARGLHLIQHLLRNQSQAVQTPQMRSRLQRLTNNTLRIQKENKLKLKPQKKITEVPKHDISSKGVTLQKKKIRYRTIKAKKIVKRPPFYDEADKEAMQKMTRARCDWSPEEDSFLLLCKVASSFLDSMYPKNLVVPYTIVRDLLHKHLPDQSLNKTSRACQRRLRYMTLNSTTVNNVQVFLGELKQDSELVQEFDKPKPSKSKEEVWKNMFTVILEKIMNKFTLPAADRCKNIVLPGSLAEFESRFQFIKETTLCISETSYKEPENSDEIQKFVLHCLILSAMALKQEEGTTWVYLLHKLYQNYTENVLKSTVNNMRKERIIAMKKSINRSDLKKSLQVTCPYKFSITYDNTMLTKFPYKAYADCSAFLKSISNSPNNIIELKGELPPGYAATVLSLATMNQLTIQTEIPDQVIMFDSSLSREVQTNIVERIFPNLTCKESEELSMLLNKKSEIHSETASQEKTLSKVDPVIEDMDLNKFPDHINTVEDIHQSFTNASRFALYLLRQEMTQAPVDRAQHSQDFIVLNACKVLCKMESADPPPIPLNPSEVIEETPLEQKEFLCEYIPQDKVVLTEDTISDIAKVVSMYLPPQVFVGKDNYIDSIDSIYEPYTDQTLLDAKFILECIYATDEKGIEEKKIWAKFQALTGELSLFEHLHLFRVAILVLRVGIKAFTYVGSCFGKNWILTSYRLPENFRGKKCNHQPGKEDTDVVAMEVDSSDMNAESSIKNGTAINTKSNISKDSIMNNKPDVNNEYPSTSGLYPAEICKQCIAEDGLGSNGSDTKITMSSLSNLEEVCFLPRTWRHPDGSLNHHTFFDLMSTVLSHIMTNPASSTQQVCERFALVLPPVQTLELIEILEISGCVYKYYCKPAKKCGLFSSIGNIAVTENPGPEDFDHIESLPDAICKIERLRSALKEL